MRSLRRPRPAIVATPVTGLTEHATLVSVSKWKRLELKLTSRLFGVSVVLQCSSNPCVTRSPESVKILPPPVETARRHLSAVGERNCRVFALSQALFNTHVNFTRDFRFAIDVRSGQRLGLAVSKQTAEKGFEIRKRQAKPPAPPR